MKPIHDPHEILDISMGRVTLLTVVKALREYLTSEEDELRTKGNHGCFIVSHTFMIEPGVDFLSTVLVHCAPTALNRQSSAKCLLHQHDIVTSLTLSKLVSWCPSIATN